MRYIVVGSEGRLGKAVCRILEDKKEEIEKIDIGDEIENLGDVEFDAILDVSCAKNSVKTLEFAKERKIPIVIGCTGHSEKELEKIKAASADLPVFLAYNFSLGMSAFKDALKKICSAPISGAYIFDLHHSQKKDSPSGTAKELSEIIEQAGIKVKNIVSQREGGYIGEHRVELFMAGEKIEITHSAESRDCFAMGAVRALEFISSADKGLYGMEDLK